MGIAGLTLAVILNLLAILACILACTFALIVLALLTVASIKILLVANYAKDFIYFGFFTFSFLTSIYLISAFIIHPLWVSLFAYFQ